MALYTPESRERVRDAVDFVELVSARTELRRSGASRYEGLCPFHDERSPSFGINPTEKVYYCFGCQAKGDLFTFVQDTEGVDFKGALELLAERYGVQLEREEEDPQEAQRRRRRDRLGELLERTAAYYERCLWESAEAEGAREYLSGRGLGDEALKEFRVGYSPDAWDRVLNGSLKGGFSEQELMAVGLIQRRERGGAYDRFRGRIMFPLCDLRGRVLGFGARSLGQDGPKYLNSTDNEVYHKGQHVYGAHLARAAAAKAGTVILCEGYTDTIALHQAGMRAAVGLMGTALTGEQVGELGRMAQTVLLALDADSAGQEAMLRAAAVAAKRRLELRVVAMPAGADPAEVLQRDGQAALEQAFSASIPFVRFRVERTLAAGDRDSPEGRDRIIDALRPVFAELPPSAMRMELTKLVSNSLDLPGSLAEQMLAQGGAGRAAAAGGPRASGSSPGARGPAAGGGGGVGGEAGSDRGSRQAGGGAGAGAGRRGDTQRAFLALCLAAPEAGAKALASLDVEEAFSSELLRRAARHLMAGGLVAPMKTAAGEELDLDADPELKGLLAELVVQAGREDSRPDMLEVQRLQLELERIDRGIQRARGNQDEAVVGLARERAELKREFDQAVTKVLE